MRRWTSWGAALLLVVLLAVRGSAQDKDNKDAKDAPKKADAKDAPDPKDAPKKPDPKMPAPKKEDAEKKLTKTGTISGELVHIEPGKQQFRVKVTYQYTEVNQGEVQAYQQELYNAQVALAKRDYNGARNHQQSALQHQAKIYSLKSNSKEYSVEGTADLKVRLSKPKATFDDMGNIKVPTEKEIAAMRGKDKFFDGEFSDLTVGSFIQVTLILPKVGPKKKDDLDVKETQLEATKIVLVKEPGVDAPPGPGVGKKPKK
jgi:hypothetical protein